MTMPAADAGISAQAANDSVPTTARAVTTETLKQALLSLIDEATDAEVQVEASRLTTCLVDLGPAASSGDLTLIESGVAALKAKGANIQVAKFVRNRLEIAHRNKKSGLVPWISRKLGDSPVYAMLVGVVSSAVIWAVAFGATLAISAFWMEHTGANYIMPIDETKPLVFAAFIGSLVSLLSRVDEFANLYIFDPFLVFLNAFLKPLIGTAVALTIYAIFKSGVVQVSGITLAVSGDGYRYIFWALGFLAGFSERLASDLIARAQTVVGRPSEKKESA
jgi:hypothetical protein